MARANDRQVIEAGVPLQFDEVAPSALEGERSYVVVKFLLHDRTGKPHAVCGIATDVTESRRAQQMQAAMAREKERLALQRAAELALANDALRECLDALASVPDLDDFLGQVMAAMTRDIILGMPEAIMTVVNVSSNAATASMSRPSTGGGDGIPRGAAAGLRRWVRCSVARWARSAR